MLHKKKQIEEIITVFFIYKIFFNIYIFFFHILIFIINLIILNTSSFIQNINGRYFWNIFLEYIFEKLYIKIPETLINIDTFIIFRNYNCYKEKIIVYWAEIEYEFLK